MSFDTFHPDKERIYRLVSEREWKGDKTWRAGMVDPAGATVREDITGLEAVSVFYNYYAKVRIKNDEGIKQFDAPRYGIDPVDIVITDPFYFDIFKYDWVAGTPASFSVPFAVVLTTDKAHKYFGNLPYEEMIGKEITYGEALHAVVTGIIKPWKQNTDFIFTDFISTASIPGSELSNFIDMTAWGMWNSSTQVFVKLLKGADPATVEAQFPAWADKYLLKGADMQIRMVLQPLSDIHFNTDLKDDYSHQAHLPTLYGLMAIAVFILLIAAFNFINLSTAQSMQRSKEVGIRKVLGGKRSVLIGQFLGETFIITLFAAIISLLVAYPLVGLFHSFMPPQIIWGLTRPVTWLFFVGVIACTTLLAGLYPAKVLSGDMPVSLMKGASTHKQSSKGMLRKFLIVFQFTISLAFIISTLIITDQLHYMMNKDLGFDKDAIVNIKIKGNKEVLTERIGQFPYVQMVSIHTAPPAAQGHPGTIFKYNADGEEREIAGVALEFCDENFIPLYGLRLVAGRNLLPSPYMKEFVINETFARQLGFNNPQDAVGQPIISGQWDRIPDNELVPEGPRQAMIVGVVSDFHLTPLHEQIKPMGISATTRAGRIMSVKIATTGKGVLDVKRILADMEKTWKDINPGERFEMAFYDDSVKAFYEKEQKMAQIISTAMSMAIFISCMGLFGLAVFTTKQRTKEIGIRKVLGASISNILLILSGGFLKLVVVATVLASPIAWYAMSRWLEGFAYHVPVRWWIFILAGTLAALIAVITIGLQTIKAARANPVNAIKSE